MELSKNMRRLELLNEIEKKVAATRHDVARFVDNGLIDLADYEEIDPTLEKARKAVQKRIDRKL